jgi:hypothetical protein
MLGPRQIYLGPQGVEACLDMRGSDMCLMGIKLG